MSVFDVVDGRYIRSMALSFHSARGAINESSAAWVTFIPETPGEEVSRSRREDNIYQEKQLMCT